MVEVGVEFVLLCEQKMPFSSLPPSLLHHHFPPPRCFLPRNRYSMIRSQPALVVDFYAYVSSSPAIHASFHPLSLSR